MSNYMKTLNINNNAFYAFVSRWFFSCNHKDIGTFYLIFVVLSFSIRILLASPESSFLSYNHNLYNVIVTGDASQNSFLYTC